MTVELPLLRTSERNDFKRCPWLWQETWLKGLSTKRVPTWSWFGTAIHRGLEVWYQPGTKRGKLGDVLDAFEESVGAETGKVYTQGGELDDVEVEDGRELGREMLKGYVDHYGKDSEWEVIHPEQSFQIDVPHPTKEGKTIVVYAGTWDLLARNRRTKEFWLWDHKTRKQFMQNWEFYNINDQAGSYLWVAPEILRHLGIFGKKDKIEGLVFNLLRKKMPDPRPFRVEAGRRIYLNQNGSDSKMQPAPLFHREIIERYQVERVAQAKRVQQEALWMKDIRQGKREAFKTPTEDCVRCSLFDYCSLDEYSKEEAAEFARFNLIWRDKYADHREAMERGGVVL
jgi:hypothetical protein